MPLLTNPTRPKPPRMNKRRQLAQKDSQTTLREEPEETDLFDIVSAPPVPPKLDTMFDQKTLPATPRGSDIYLQRTNLNYRPSTSLPKPSGKQSTANRWKSAVGKIIGFKKATSKPKYLPPPPLSPASSREPSFYGPTKDSRPHRSAVTLLNSPASSLHNRFDEDEDMVTNIGLSRSSSQNVTPISTMSPQRAFSIDRYEPITTVLQRADLDPSPTPVTALPLSPITPAVYPPRSATPPSRNTTPVSMRDSPPRTIRSTKSHRSMPAPSRTPPPPVELPARTDTPPATSVFTWPPPGSPPLIVANPPSTAPPHTTTHSSSLHSSPPVRRKRAQTVTVPRPAVRHHKPTASDGANKENIDGKDSPTKRTGPRILQARLPSPVSPDPNQSVFTGPWFNRRGDEWLGIGAEPGQYRSKAAKDDKAFDPKYIGYPEEPHHFMNTKGDVMDAQTLRMVSKAHRL